ncbi:MAG: anthranilate phosphoribosyltransferase [Chloroflexi bacterium]|nr:anthranilate phosphoribosyltransferase [Chloroflexota bacterium]
MSDDAQSTPYEQMRTYLREIGQGPRAGRDLNREEAASAIGLILDGEATSAQAGGFLLLQRYKGESVDELLGFVDAYRARANLIRPAVEGLLDIGSPYDGRKKSIVVSSASAIVVAAAGAPVVLHGEKDMGPKHGVPVGDVLEALGIDVDGEPAAVQSAIESHGLGYMRQERFVPAVYAARELREEVALRTLFATVEKIANIAAARYSIIGIAHLPYKDKMLDAAGANSFERVLVVQGIEGNEDVPTSRPCRAYLREGQPNGSSGKTTELTIDASQYGLEAASKEEMEGGDARHNAEIAESIFAGQKGAYRDLIALNAAVRLWLAERAPDIAAGLDLARQTIDSGAAAEKLEALRAVAGRAG